MYEQQQIRELLEKKFEVSKENLSNSNQELNEIQTELKKLDADNKALYNDHKRNSDEIFNNSTATQKELIKKKEELEMKSSNAKWLGIVILGLYSIVAVYMLFVLKLDFSISPIVVYMLAVVLGIVIYIIPVAIKRAKLKPQIKQINNSPEMVQYLKNQSDAFALFSQKRNDLQKLIDQRKQEANKIKTKIHQFENESAEILEELNNLEFNCAYAGSILFYGKDKHNHYDLYLDGRHYDTVRGHNIIQIRLSQGLHNLKIENTSYNIADRSDVVYSYSFNTQQIEVTDIPVAFFYVCEFKTLKRVNGKEFEQITKTKLI